MVDSEKLPNECAVCSTPCVEMYCSQDCYLVGSGKGFACIRCGSVRLNNPRRKGRAQSFCGNSCYREAHKAKTGTAECCVCCKPFLASGDALYCVKRGKGACCSAACRVAAKSRTVKRLAEANKEKIKEKQKETPSSVPCLVCKKDVLLWEGSPRSKSARTAATQRANYLRGKPVMCGMSCAAKHRKAIASENPTTQP